MTVVAQVRCVSDSGGSGEIGVSDSGGSGEIGVSDSGGSSDIGVEWELGVRGRGGGGGSRRSLDHPSLMGAIVVEILSN